MIKKQRLLLFLCIISTIFLACNIMQDKSKAYAEILYYPDYNFSIKVPDNWEKNKPKNPGILFSYSEPGVGDNMNMSVQNISASSVKEVPLKKTIGPFFYPKINVVLHKYLSSDEVVIRHCIYRFKKGRVKDEIEGKYNLQYYMTQWVWKEKLYTLTFTTAKDEFDSKLEFFASIVGTVALK